MNAPTSTERHAEFNPPIRPYLVVTIGFTMAATIIGVPLAVIWFCGVGQWWARHYFAKLECHLGDRALRYRKGIIVQVEKTIPLENIQDVTFIEGPLLRRFHLSTLKFETAGHAQGHSGHMEFTGIIDAHQFRNDILAARASSRISWRQESVAEWRPQMPADLVYSNAALHWLPDHAVLFPRLMRTLASGGVLAVQMPRNFAAPSHTLIAETVRCGPWRSRLERLLGPPPVDSPDFCYGVPAPLASSLDIWESEYLQALRGDDPVKEWVKGTWLKQFLDFLDPTERTPFEADYARRLRDAYPAETDGTTLFPFRRLFVVATRS